MKTVKTSVEDAFEIALVLGLKDTTEEEKIMFINMLYEIASVAKEEAEEEVIKTMNKLVLDSRIKPKSIK